MSELLPVVATPEQEAELVKQWRESGSVGPHPLSPHARFERGEDIPYTQRVWFDGARR